MKKWVVCLLILGWAHVGLSQDVVVTTTGDTLACKITRITQDYIHFSIFDKSGVLLLKSRLPRSEVAFFNQSSESNALPDTTNVPVKEEDRIFIDSFEPARFRLSVNAGYTYQFGGYKGMPESYQQQVKSLWNLGGDFHFFTSEFLGIGVAYNRISTKAQEDFEPPLNQLFKFSSLTDEQIRFTYLGLSLMYRNLFYDDQSINYFISGGLIHYRTDFKGDGIPMYQEGETLGLSLGLAYDFILTQHMGAGLGVALNVARISEMDDNGSIVQADFDLTRIDFTLGIRFYQ